MPFVSYAQNFEDVLLWRVFKGVKQGVYIDVGANHPLVDSVTKAFYEAGWRGVNIEPISSWYELLLDDRSEDVNLNVALSNDSRSIRLFDVVGTALSTSVPKYAEERRLEGHVVNAIEVPALTLSEVCEQYNFKQIHFLKIDVEGSEREVLEGADFNKFRPWIILVEATEPCSPNPNHCEWEVILLENDYRFVWFDGLNRFYVASEKAELSELLARPPNPFDDYISYRALSDQDKLLALQEREQEQNNTIEQLLESKKSHVAAMSAMQDVVRDFQQKNNELRESLAQSEDKVDTLERQVADLVREYGDLQSELEANYWHSRQENMHLSDRLKKIESSFSWKLVKPFRIAKRNFRKKLKQK